jgi:hypothetical protein
MKFYSENSYDKYPKMTLSELGDSLDSYQDETVIIEDGYTISDLQTLSEKVEYNLTLEPYLPQFTYATLYKNPEEVMSIKRKYSYEKRFQTTLITLTNEFKSPLLKSMRETAHFLVVPEGIAKLHYHTGPMQFYYDIDPYVNLRYFITSWTLDVQTVLDWYETKITSQEALIAPLKRTLYTILNQPNFRNTLEAILEEDEVLDNLIKENPIKELYHRLKGRVSQAQLLPFTTVLLQPDIEDLIKLQERQDLHNRFFKELTISRAFSPEAITHLEQFFKLEFKNFLDTYEEEGLLESHKEQLFKIKLREYSEREISRLALEELERIIRETGNFKMDREEF